jgi:uncharacterized protein YjbI with pentapeptide repeats
MQEERQRPGPWKVWRGDVARWKRPFLFFDWVCEWAVYHLRRWAFIELLELGGRLFILVSVVSFALNYRDVQQSQRKAKHYQAWQVINLASGKPGSGGRGDALKDLVEDGVPLNNIDLTNAILGYVNLTGASLGDANLTNADLSGANLTGAYLGGVNLTGASLGGANLTGASLGHANLTGAYLGGANLKDAFLWGANLKGANLKGANLKGADLWGADLKGADLWGADLKRVQELDCTNLMTAKNWAAAFRDKDLGCGAEIPTPPNK